MPIGGSIVLFLTESWTTIRSNTTPNICAKASAKDSPLELDFWEHLADICSDRVVYFCFIVVAKLKVAAGDF